MRNRYLYDDNPEWLDWTCIICGLGLFTALIAGALAAESATPIPQTGAFCPIGYYRTSGYCVPLPKTTRQAIPRTGTCPPTTIRESSYCLTNSTQP